MINTKPTSESPLPHTNKIYKLLLVGNPNVGKSTLFNRLTKESQHTGNWSGKTVESTKGRFTFKNSECIITDLPGIYSLHSNSAEEVIANDIISGKDYDCAIIVANSCFLEKSLLLTLQILTKTTKCVMCLNMTDELKKKNITIDLDELSLQLGIPVVTISALNNKGITKLIETATDVADTKIITYKNCEFNNISNSFSQEEETVQLSLLAERIYNIATTTKGNAYTEKDRKLDKLFTSKITGVPIMLAIFLLIFWLTIIGANYPSQWLSCSFGYIKEHLENLLQYININSRITSFIVDGIYATVTWVISVMLPPAAIFFPLFALLEDSGYLPRIAFMLDSIFKKSGVNGKLSLTMLMGFGCNTCGVLGCRIMSTKKERLISALTNSFVPCNGRLPTLIAIISLYFSSKANQAYKNIASAFMLTSLILLSFVVTFITAFILSKVIASNETSSFIIELPPYRKPKIIKTIVATIKEKVIYVLSRAILISIPAGIVIWLLSNINFGTSSIFAHLAEFLNPLGKKLGMDGFILLGFILGFPANEIVLPIILMGYINSTTLTEYSSISELGTILNNNGWTIITAIAVCIFCLFHFPCSTTCFAIKKETDSKLWTFVSVLIPLAIGTFLCFCINTIAKLF